MQYAQGSIWRKWDLHAHTPLDKDWINRPSLSTSEQKEAFAKEYIRFASRQELALIGITDHNFCNNLDDLLLPYIQVEAANASITILPGFEVTSRDGSGVHLLVLFPKNAPLPDIKGIVDQLFNPGQVKIPSNGGVPASNKNIDEIKNVLNSSKLEYLLLFAHADRDNGVLDGDTFRGELRIGVWKKSYVNICQLSKPIKEFTGGFAHDVIYGVNPDYKREMSYIVASDCRAIDDSMQLEEGRCYLGQKFTWIKADPTFEGLKQIIYEFNERVRVQETNPQNDYIKPYFSKIKLKKGKLFDNEEVMFSDDEIILNPNFVAIIGGRGTGKSLLLDAIAKTFSQVDDKARAADMTTSSDFIISYTKEDGSVMDYSRDGTEFLDYLHVSQGSVRNIVNEAEILDSEIKRMLEIQKSFKESESDYPYRLNIDERFKLKKWFEVQNEKGDYINSREYNLAIKAKNQKLIDTITTPKNKEFIENYCKNKSEIDLYGKRKIFLTDLKAKIADELTTLNSDIEEINKVSDSKLAIPIFNFGAQEKAIEKLIKDYSSKISTLQESNKEIEQNLKEKGITGDLTTLLEKISDYQDEIDEATKRIETYDKNIERLEVLVVERTGFADKICDDISTQKQKIKEGWEALKKGKEGWSDEQSEIITELLQHISIDGRISFNVEMFYKEARKFINEVRFKETKSKSILDRIKDLLNVTDYDSFVKLIKNEKIIKNDGNSISLEELLDTECFVKQGDRDFLELLFYNNHRARYLKVVTDIKYLGKAVNKLSVGQRGTLYLCLKLATEAFFTPFVFDQPEDDLDNPFIMEQLVPIFKKIKKYRQVIIVTHNANLVVNTDAEQVIVADNEEEILFYTSGALENVESVSGKSTFLNDKWIKKLICDVLEGGRPAFEQREKKYGFILVK